MMIDDNAPTHERRKLIKTYKNVLPRKQTVFAEVCRETYSRKKSDKMGLKKMATDVINHAKKGNAEKKERKKERKIDLMEYVCLCSQLMTYFKKMIME